MDIMASYGTVDIRLYRSKMRAIGAGDSPLAAIMELKNSVHDPSVRVRLAGDGCCRWL